MISLPCNTKRSSSPNVKVRTFTQRGEAESFDDSKENNFENKNVSPPRRQCEKRRKLERHITDIFESLDLPSVTRATSLFEPTKLSRTEACSMDIDRSIFSEMEELSSLPSTLSASPSIDPAGIAGEMADTADCAIPPSPSYLRHSYRTCIPVLTSEYTLSHLSEDPELYAADIQPQQTHDSRLHHQQPFSRTSFPIYEDPDDIEVQFQEIKVNVFAPWDEDKENVDEATWAGEPEEGDRQHESSTITQSTNPTTSNAVSLFGANTMIETYDLNLHPEVEMDMDMDLELDLDNFTMFPAPDNSLFSTPTTNSTDTNALNRIANVDPTAINGHDHASASGFFDPDAARLDVGSWTQNPDLVAPYPVVNPNQGPSMNGDDVSNCILDPMAETSMNLSVVDFGLRAEDDQITPDASGLWLPWSAAESVATSSEEMARLALAIAQQREEEQRAHVQAQIETAVGRKRVRRRARRL
ncbi:uncharacterized protein BP01DRAFT_396322 [Aspergillus saccharolyticus JOP 1030-1]|uniref:Uncharacterized protein n=1 Tax=Aspergillus saccharolyticus JOP 1030-1 TaxID=1450539 RepID=A0A318ZZD7_9EURO|nr:hypothetical protein BP01DRAFT_396322 [Aspergillus saccharolyticus JOP 1030-1]PYH49643.1 hypothetical protein BP01DRAFT_396322 [Aspergillus saccharolyticus JOP 1030-1]